ncbi:SDR family oxidoreductase [Altererythrobacter sp. SALINAS58]|uniref:3-oxoacyl-ACP reductase FabG n=1 Tax=Alteripontixanthobacter muriae TaxID=2705546 RepID=UPI0015754129|nr:3-oxoacyl-ACP reductase FabG [Alteripontixanthobacter muriae]NTZ43816.1 SDR family oxidoreductase [Alteripontixanthobacter muriae]
MTRPVAIVTGGGRGIGAAIAARLAEDGHDVAMLDLSEEACRESCAAVEAHGARALAVAADVSDEDAVERAIHQVSETLAPPFVLINNAGILRDRTVTKMTLEDWTAVIDVNLKSVFLTSRACIPHMAKNGGGRIVSLSSTAALGTFGEANYSAAKAGVIGLTKTLALEGGRHGITANVVAPGFVVTEMTRAVADRSGMTFESLVEQMKRETCVGRVGKPEDIAQAVSFFADRRSSFITGQVLFVAGAPRG